MINFENINCFEEGKKRIQITKEDFTGFIRTLPSDKVEYDSFDICEDPMGGFIQEITNNLLYRYGDTYLHQTIIKRGPVRTDNPLRIWQIDGLINEILKERE